MSSSIYLQYYVNDCTLCPYEYFDANIIKSDKLIDVHRLLGELLNVELWPLPLGSDRYFIFITDHGQDIISKTVTSKWYYIINYQLKWVNTKYATFLFAHAQYFICPTKTGKTRRDSQICALNINRGIYIVVPMFFLPFWIVLQYTSDFYPLLLLTIVYTYSVMKILYFYFLICLDIGTYYRQEWRI